MYEEHHKVKNSSESLVVAARLSVRYLTDRFLPDKVCTTPCCMVAPCAIILIVAGDALNNKSSFFHLFQKDSNLLDEAGSIASLTHAAKDEEEYGDCTVAMVDNQRMGGNTTWQVGVE
jgi:hypothetical protein